MQDNETDFPGVVDLNSLTMAQLKGKKVSSDQARTIKGTFIVRNEVSRKFECELCDFVSDWKTTIQVNRVGFLGAKRPLQKNLTVHQLYQLAC